jgi:hypothetical protein
MGGENQREDDEWDSARSTLRSCERAACRRDARELADASPLLVCWECGAVESETVAAEGVASRACASTFPIRRRR